MNIETIISVGLGVVAGYYLTVRVLEQGKAY